MVAITVEEEAPGAPAETEFIVVIVLGPPRGGGGGGDESFFSLEAGKLIGPLAPSYVSL